MLTATGEPTPAEDIDANQCPVMLWPPRWVIDCGKDCEVGITIDDHCFIVLVKNWAGQWVPTTHIPLEAAEKLGELAASITP